MPVPELPGIAEARQALAAGRAVVLPSPSPLVYGVAATVPHLVNAAKGRPRDQAVAVWLHEDTAWHELRSALQLQPDALATAFGLLRRELVTLLVPLHPDPSPPAWVTPAVRDGHALLFGARWAPLTRLLAEFPHLYLSSANRTGHPPAATAAEAAAMFPSHVPVVDGDALRDPDRRHASTTMLRMTSTGDLILTRRGIQDTTHSDPAAYVAHCMNRYAGKAAGNGRVHPTPA
jgi:L-threonylcarbamoyladenylate synthase